MQPLVVSNNAASGIFAIAFGGWIFFEIVLTGRNRPKNGAKQRDRGSGPFIFGAMICAFFIMDAIATSVPATAMGGAPWAIFAAGIAVALAGVGVRLWAIRTLGRSFTTLVSASPEQRVVDSGPYRLIRHPSYTGALIAVLGAALCFANWLSLLAVVPAFLAYSYRIRVEEVALQAQLGEAYGDYRQRTKRLVPFVY